MTSCSDASGRIVGEPEVVPMVPRADRYREVGIAPVDFLFARNPPRIDAERALLADDPGG
jgi:hypothetical protein